MSEPKTIPAISPYLTVNGAKKAAEFYHAVFGAEVTGEMPAEDGERMMHMSLQIRGSTVMLSDEFPEWSEFKGPRSINGSAVAISLTLDTPEDVDKLYKKAIDHGATSSYPPENMFWGDRFCQIIDPFNHRWMLVAALPEKG